MRNTKPKWVTVTGGGADMAVESRLEAGLNPTSDPTSQFQVVTQGEKRVTGYVWTCKRCQGTFTGHKRKLTIHIAGKKFLNDKEMGVRPCTPAAVIKQGDQFVPNTEQQALLKRTTYRRPEQDVEESGQEAGESVF